jgi:hypothetical protein
MVTVGNGVTASVRAQIASLGANTLILVLNPSGRQAGSETPRPLINEGGFNSAANWSEDNLVPNVCNGSKADI